MSRRGLVAALVVLAAGCAHEQVTPAPVPELADNGPPVATYQLPVTQPKGTVNVVSMGLEALPAGSDGQAAFYLHVRLAALNGSDAVTWSFDPNDQVLAYAGLTVLPAYAEAVTAELRGPVLSLGAGARGHLDLYYPTPVGDVPAVTFSWRLQRGKEVLAMGTELRRMDHQRNGYAYYQPADDAYVAAGLGMGSWWWQDYYFWHDERCWWSYPRADFHARYPGYQRPVRVAQPAGATAQSGGGTRGSLNHDDTDTSSWRGVPSSESSRSSSSSSDTSSWRSSPSQDTSSSSSASSTDSSSSSPGPSSTPSSSSSSSGSSSGGESKSGWRR